MNNTKRTLILTAAILEFVSVALLLFSILVFALASDATIANILADSGIDPSQYNSMRIGFIVFFIFALVFDLIAPILLMYSIRNQGKEFKNSKKAFIAGFVLTIIAGPTNISAILLYIAFAMGNNTQSQTFVNNTTNTQNGTVTDYVESSSLQDSIRQLKQLKDAGTISDEEYKKTIIARLRKAKDSGEITQEKFDEILTKII